MLRAFDPMSEASSEPQAKNTTRFHLAPLRPDVSRNRDLQNMGYSVSGRDGAMLPDLPLTFRSE